MTAPRKLLYAILLAAVSIAAAGPSATPVARAAPPRKRDAGDFLIVYAPASGAKHKRARRLVEQSGRFERVVQTLNDQIMLPANVTIRFDETHSGEGTSYDPSGRLVVIDYEFVAHTFDLFTESNALRMSPDEATLAVTEFVLYHEIGHALVDLLDLPVLGREEDAVDALATILSIELAGDGNIGIAAALMFGMEAGDRTEIDEDEFWDEHSLDEQRMFSIICWIYGSDPTAYRDIARDVDLPDDQRVVCENDYARKLRSWSKVLGPYLKSEK